MQPPQMVGPVGSKPAGLTITDDYLLFFADDGNGWHVWATNSAMQPPQMIGPELTDGGFHAPVMWAQAGDNIYFLLGKKLGVIDTPASPDLVSEIAVRQELTILNKDFLDLDSAEPATATFGDKLYFTNDYSWGNNNRLDTVWVSDGTPEGTQFIADYFGHWDDQVRSFNIAGDYLYYRFAESGRHTKIDTTTNQVVIGDDWRNLSPGLADVSSVSRIDMNWAKVRGDTTLYFNAWAADGTAELWRTNGTVEGTAKINGMPPGSGFLYWEQLGELPIIIRHAVGVSDGWGDELWTVDAVTGSAVSLSVGHPNWPVNASEIWLDYIIPADDRLYFTVWNAPVSELQLWQTDGVQTRFLKDIGDSWPSDFGYYHHFATIGNSIYIDTLEDGYVNLWGSNGTSERTEILVDLAQNSLTGSGNDWINHLTTAGDTLYFNQGSMSEDYSYEENAWFMLQLDVVQDGTTLFVNGTSENDELDIQFLNTSGDVEVLRNGQSLGIFEGLSTIQVDGGLGSGNKLKVSCTTGDDVAIKTPGQISWSAPFQKTMLYTNIANLEIYGREGNDIIRDPGSNTSIFGGPGNDTIVIDATSGNGVLLDGGEGADEFVVEYGSLAGQVTIEDNAAEDNHLTIRGALLDDQGAPEDNAIVLTDNQVTRTNEGAVESILYSSIASVTIENGYGANTVAIESTSSEVTVKSLGGTDNVVIALGSLVGAVTIDPSITEGSTSVTVVGTEDSDALTVSASEIETASSEVIYFAAPVATLAVEAGGGDRPGHRGGPNHLRCGDHGGSWERVQHRGDPIEPRGWFDR